MYCKTKFINCNKKEYEKHPFHILPEGTTLPLEVSCTLLGIILSGVAAAHGIRTWSFQVARDPVTFKVYEYSTPYLVLNQGQLYHKWLVPLACFYFFFFSCLLCVLLYR
jgi:hypothetical protein